MLLFRPWGFFYFQRVNGLSNVSEIRKMRKEFMGNTRSRISKNCAEKWFVQSLMPFGVPVNTFFVFPLKHGSLLSMCAFRHWSQILSLVWLYLLHLCMIEVLAFETFNWSVSRMYFYKSSWKQCAVGTMVLNESIWKDNEMVKILVSSSWHVCHIFLFPWAWYYLTPSLWPNGVTYKAVERPKGLITQRRPAAYCPVLTPFGWF